MVYWISLYIFKFIVKVFFRGKCYNRENMPKKGPFVGIINHSSLFDIPALTIAFKHRAATMVKHSLFSVPVLGWWLNAVDMFPVKRNESDDESFKWALSQLKRDVSFLWRRKEQENMIRKICLVLVQDS